MKTTLTTADPPDIPRDQQGRVRDVYDLSDMDATALADLERIRREGGAKPSVEPKRIPERE